MVHLGAKGANSFTADDVLDSMLHASSIRTIFHNCSSFAVVTDSAGE